MRVRVGCSNRLATGGLDEWLPPVARRVQNPAYRPPGNLGLFGLNKCCILQCPLFQTLNIRFPGSKMHLPVTIGTQGDAVRNRIRTLVGKVNDMMAFEKWCSLYSKRSRLRAEVASSLGKSFDERGYIN